MAAPYDPASDLYLLLKVQPSSSREQVRKAYLAAIRRAHPDVSRHPKAKAAAQALNEARRVLLDPKLRAEYDAARQRCFAEALEKMRLQVIQQSAPPASFERRPTQIARPAKPKTLADSAELLARAVGVKSPIEVAVWRGAAAAVEIATRKPRQRKVTWRPGVTRSGAAVCRPTTARSRRR